MAKTSTYRSKTQDYRELRSTFMKLENELNKIEEMLLKAEAEVQLNAISWHFGKVYEIYQNIASMLDIFEPKVGFAKNPPPKSRLTEVPAKKQ
jgi:hypothetical protein